VHLACGQEMADAYRIYGKIIIFEGIKCYVPQKILSKNLDPEYYNKEGKQLKVRVRKMYN
jgi:hypothetical protein